ncbi:MAG TPA: hypothetical protein V6D47_13135 [Oscillatoriaceae cyanobacterium]
MTTSTEAPEFNGTQPSIDAPEHEAHEAETGEKLAETSPKKAISLRLSVEDLNLAKDLAAELNIGYQTLLCQLIHDGLQSEQETLKVRKLVSQIRASLPDLKAAQELLNSPAVKSAQAVLADPAVKAAEQLVNSPAVKAAQELAKDVANNPTVQKVRDFGTTSYTKAAEELANSPVAKMLKDLTNNPTFKAAQELAESTSAKIAHDWANSPAGRFSREISASAAEATAELRNSDEVKDLTKAVREIQETLKKANLM